MLIGLSGKKRAGKNSVADHLTARYGFEQIAFADIMRDAALALDPIIHGRVGDTPAWRLSDEVNDLGWEYAKADPEVRRTLQRLGTEVGRDTFGPDFWVERTFEKHTVDMHRVDGRRIVVTDVRFPNEVDAVAELSGTVIRIVRPGLPTTDEHPSETALDDHDFEHRILNDRGLVGLRAQTERLMDRLL